jgi:hypothetical protein
MSFDGGKIISIILKGDNIVKIEYLKAVMPSSVVGVSITNSNGNVTLISNARRKEAKWQNIKSVKTEGTRQIYK